MLHVGSAGRIGLARAFLVLNSMQCSAKFHLLCCACVASMHVLTYYVACAMSRSIERVREKFLRARNCERVPQLAIARAKCNRLIYCVSFKNFLFVCLFVCFTLFLTVVVFGFTCCHASHAYATLRRNDMRDAFIGTHTGHKHQHGRPFCSSST